MTVISLIVVLLLEQLQPLAERKMVAVPLSHYAHFFEGHFNDGQEQHGMIAWLLAVLPATIACAAVYFMLSSANPLLGFLWNVAVLYLTLGFRQFSHYYTDIHLALRMGETGRERQAAQDVHFINEHNHRACVSRQDHLRKEAEESAHPHPSGLGDQILLQLVLQL